jgi:hypothetical protein
MDQSVPPILRAHTVPGHNAYRACSSLAIFLAPQPFRLVSFSVFLSVPGRYSFYSEFALQSKKAFHGLFFSAAFAARPNTDAGTQ